MTCHRLGGQRPKTFEETKSAATRLRAKKLNHHRLKPMGFLRTGCKPIFVRAPHAIIRMESTALNAVA